MSDYLRTVAARNLETTPTEPLPLVQPRTPARFEPFSVDAGSSLIAEEADTVSTAAPPPRQVDDAHSSAEPTIPKEFLDMLHSLSMRIATSSPVAPVAQPDPTRRPRMRNRKEADAVQPVPRAPRAAEPPSAASALAEPIVEQIAVREPARQAVSAPNAQAPQNPRVTPASQPRMDNERESHPRNRRDATKIVEIQISQPALAPSAPMPATIRPATQPSILATTSPISSASTNASRITDHAPRISPPAAPAPPPIHVTIGRVEVRATAPSQPAQTPRRTAVPIMTLDDYLAERNGKAKGGRR